MQETDIGLVHRSFCSTAQYNQFNRQRFILFLFSQRFTGSEELMDISSGYTTSAVHHTTQHAIPTSVITPTTSLANGWLEAQNSNLHGGFVPPPVSSSSGMYAIPTSAIRSVPQSQQRMIPGARLTKQDLDLLRMSPSNSRRRIRDDEVSIKLKLQFVK